MREGRGLTWTKLDDGFWSNPKVTQVGLAGAGAYARCLSYCGDQETDGKVPADIARYIGTPAVFKRLVDAGLMRRNGSGFVIPDYLDFNPSRETLERKRARDRARKAADS